MAHEPALSDTLCPSTPLYYALGYALHLACGCGWETRLAVEEIALSRRVARDTRLSDIPRRLRCDGCGAAPDLRGILPAACAGHG